MSRKKRTFIARVLCFILAALMVFGAVTPLVFGADIKYEDKDGKIIRLDDFKDTKGHWAQSTVLKWADYEMISGHNGNFMPNQPMKRGDVAVVLDRMMGLTTVSYNFFNDLPNDAYYRDAMLRNVAAGYFSGTGENTVNPLGNTTREEIAVILCRVFKIDTSSTGKTHFVDDNQISSWARPSVYALSKLGYMNGDGRKVSPKSKITRAEIIQLFDNIAEVYIPKKDTTGQGDVFSVIANKNFITSRNIELVRSKVGRDLITTQSARNLILKYTTVDGRIIALGSGTIELINSSVKSIELHNKVSLTGVSNSTKEVYIAEYGTESTLDSIPDRLILEPGVRVRIDGVMYENLTTKNKIYLGLEIKADISAEQGFVTGGPRVSGVKALHTYDNNLSFKEIRLQVGQSKIKEVGVIYTSGSESIPTLSNYFNKIEYNGNISSSFDINVGKTSGERTYRIYTIDSNGLIGYSQPITVKAYDFNIELELFDMSYPEAIRVEVLFSGNSIPNVSSVRVVHSTSSLYVEDLPVITLGVAQVGEDDKNNVVKNVIRYMGQVNSKSAMNPITGEREFEPSTEFGYIITFQDGSVLRTFPVLTNAAPKDIAPVDTLSTGNARFTSVNKLEIANSYIRSRHVQIQEAGIIYREVPKGASVKQPDIGLGIWKEQMANVNIGLKDTAYFTTSLPINSDENETHFAAYIKTATGYYYGSVKTVQNNLRGVEGGPKITGAPEITVLNENTTVVKIPVSLTKDLDFDKIGSILKFTDKQGNEVNYYDGMDLNSAEPYLGRNKTNITLIFDKLEANNTYNVTLQLFDIKGDPSNAVIFTINTANMVDMRLLNKVETTSQIQFDFIINNITDYNTRIDFIEAKVFNANSIAYIDTKTSPWKLVVRNAPLQEFDVYVTFDYYIARGIGDLKTVEFDRLFTIKN